MKRWRWAALPLMAAALLWAAEAAGAQETVGGLRLVDAAGETVGQEPAPPGEKLFRLLAGVTEFTVAMDFEGAAPIDVQIRVMGPSGTVLFQETETYEAPGTQTVVVDNAGSPFAEQEYVVNAYVGPDAYLADSMQLVVGDVVLPTPGDEAPVEAQALEAQTVTQGDVAGAPADVPAAAPVPGGPSTAVLLLAVAGIVVLFGIVLWAGWSATRRA